MFTAKRLTISNVGAIGIGSMIIFIAMLLVAGIAASVIIQTANTLQSQALKTGSDTIKEVANGIKVTHISGKTNINNLTEMAIFTRPIAASDALDLDQAHITLFSDEKEVIMKYDSNYFNETVGSGGLFNTMDVTGLGATSFGIIVVRDHDGSCTSTSPVINDEDIAVLMLNISASFGTGAPTSGIGTRTQVTGGVYPEIGMRGLISFNTPSIFIDTIVELM